MDKLPAARAVSAVAALDEPTRRRLYDHVVRQPGPVGRDEVAEATGLPRATVAFHLDRLVDEQLLEVSFQRRTGRRGPGAGRPAKLYRRSAAQVSVSLPDRRYELAAVLLADAVAEADASGLPPGPILRARARAAGEQCAAGRGDIRRVLEEHGYEPRLQCGELVLGNCPFHSLARHHTELICGMNLGFTEGLLAGLGEPADRVYLHPAPDACCVRIRQSEPD
ncbi:putative ArsR family transcriptional regulator [Amycolatopsis bartoniae]|uniref:ArsR family transcriptional regulator n=1 Tax=Amycolatopsis bartoniae TaxID=941986 RepID=A0A8H9J2C6_9PSEU|nr:helix-turn-helix domain-containing protein [Amycolatopsis bartoniae]MBB2935410.1 putative ArsR family transcriptional regulator [Amycolatopsis bartoniae]TVT03720.1 helix-turn-helix domain-containing protein [Amycolatopsis bartoniae]GHF75887.1 ArsR family transcriptional regulator [Amycolatopsis bartoniae]